MGATFDKILFDPTCKCCDDLIKYVLNGCTINCECCHCCKCNMSIVDHTAEEVENAKIPSNETLPNLQSEEVLSDIEQYVSEGTDRSINTPPLRHR